MGSEQQQENSASLPDSLVELANVYDPDRRDRIIEEVEELDYTTDDAYTADQRRGITEQVAIYADADAAALGYSVAIALVGQEKWWDTHNWRLYADLIDTARDPEIGGTVEIYIPEDTAEKITARTDLTRDDIDGVMQELQGAARTFPVDDSHRRSVPGHDRPTASEAAASAAAEECPGNTVFVSYSSDAHTITEMFPGITAADPADLYAALDMNRGRYDTAPLNRVRTTVRWFGEAAESHPEHVPGPLLEPPETEAFDTAVVDECAGDEVSLKRRRDEADWTDTLAFLDTAVQASEVDVYLPEGLADDMKDHLGGEPGRRVRDDLQMLTQTLPIPPPETLDIPDRYDGMEGDYAIAEAAKRRGDRVMVVTYDDHFEEIPGVAAVTPRLGEALLATG